MKHWERVIDRRLRRETSVSENQFGFARKILSRGNTPYMEKYRERQRDLHMAFLDLEKTYDSDIPWCLIFADDIMLVSESAEGLNTRLENWRKVLEDKGLRVSREKTEYLRCDFSIGEIAHNEEVDIRIGDKILRPKESFRYLGSMLHKSERIDEDVANRIKAAWMKWRAATGVLCDRNVPLKLKGKFYRVAIRPAMLYGSECYITLANRVEVAELRMLRWTCGEKSQSAPVRRVEALVVDGLRRKGRPKLRWKDRVKHDMKELLLSEDMTSDRNEWRARISFCRLALALPAPVD
nr:hypothetical protein [Tanacetum cinerariifolium]